MGIDTFACDNNSQFTIISPEDNSPDVEIVNQLTRISNMEVYKDSNIVVMPDYHMGKGNVIGTTMHIKDAITPYFIGVDIGCVDKDTEFLTPNGWKKISEYDNDDVAVYDFTNNITKFEKPLYIKEKCKQFYHITSGNYIDQMLSDEHRLLLEDRDLDSHYKLGKSYRYNRYNYENNIPPTFYEISMNELYRNYLNNGKSVSNFNHYRTSNFKKISNHINFLHDKFITTIPNLKTDNKIKLTDNKLRLKFYASFISDSNPIEIERYKELLKKEGIYDENDLLGRNSCDYIRYFNINWWNASPKQIKILYEEFRHICGHKGTIKYESFKHNIDFIQYICSCMGQYVVIDNKRNKYNQLSCTIYNNSKIPFDISDGYKNKFKINIVPSEDGFKYCFTTSTGYWIMRRNGCICVTGNCGVHVRKLTNKRNIDYNRLDKFINMNIPSGMKRHSLKEHADRRKHEKRLSILDNLIDDLKTTDSRINNIDNIATQLGTFGGGNHYIEINKSELGDYYLSIHSGSRNFGHLVAEHYQNIAYKNCNPEDKLEEEKQKLIDFLKSNGRESEIPKNNEDFKKKFHIVPYTLSYLDKNNHLDDYNNYINDLEICQKFAKLNRLEIANQICKAMGFEYDSNDDIDTMHNYLDTNRMILRKGAVSAELDERLVISLNMKDGILLCTGIGDEFCNFSAPHGAGRVYSRKEAKEKLSMKEFKDNMIDIFSNSISIDTIDESPMAYKDSNSIIDIIDNFMVWIDERLKPVYNFKAKELER